MKKVRGPKQFVVFVGTVLCLLGSNHVVLVVVGETQVKWTPNPEDTKSADGTGTGGSKAGPLPLSMKQRQQLVQLDNVIRSSPDPTATLKKAAEANQMSPQDLLALLERNRSDLQQAGGTGSGGIMARKPPITAFLSTIVSMIVTHTKQIIKKYPRIISLLVISILVVIYGTIEKNRTGLFVSNKVLPILSNGPTTLFIPPTTFLQQYYIPQLQIIAKNTSKIHNNNNDADDKNRLFASTTAKEIVQTYFNSIATKDIFDTITTNDITLQWYDNVIPGIRTAVSTSSIIDVTEFQDRENDNDDDNDDNEKLISTEEIVATILDTADTILHDTHDITEFVSLTDTSSSISSKDTTILPTRFIKFVPATRGLSRQPQTSILIVQGLGDYNRYGLVPLRIVSEQLLDDSDTKNDDEDDDEDEDEDEDEEEEEEEKASSNDTQQTSITLQTLPPSHFDGYIHISVESIRNEKANKGNPTSIRIQVHLILPEGGKKIKSKILASDLVQGINYSIQRSIEQHTKIRLVRKYQSSLYMQHASTKALRKRNSRSSNERAIEEMAVDRRRRWQRNNPNVGYYRPSGDRMKNPNNAIVFK